MADRHISLITRSELGISHFYRTDFRILCSCRITYFPDILRHIYDLASTLKRIFGSFLSRADSKMTPVGQLYGSKCNHACPTTFQVDPYL